MIPQERKMYVITLARNEERKTIEVSEVVGKDDTYAVRFHPLTLEGDKMPPEAYMEYGEEERKAMVPAHIQQFESESWAVIGTYRY